MILKKIKSFFNNTALMALVLSLLLYITMVIFRPTALSLNSIATIFSTASMLIFVCAGQMIVITSGDGIDLSAGAMMSTTACITVELMKGDNEKLLPTILVCMAFGFFIGILNGLGVTYIGIPALIMTLCMSTVLTKLQIVISNGAPRGTVSKELSSSLTTRFFGVIPGIMIWAFLFFLVVVLFLKYTKFGHRLNLIGTNFEAANLSGIRAKRVRMLAYGLGGMMAALLAATEFFGGILIAIGLFTPCF